MILDDLETLISGKNILVPTCLMILSAKFLHTVMIKVGHSALSDLLLCNLFHTVHTSIMNYKGVLNIINYKGLLINGCKDKNCRPT